MKRLLLFSALALGVSQWGAMAQDEPLSELDMTETNWIGRSAFNDYSDDVRVVFRFLADGFTDDVKNWGVGEIASAGQENKVAFCKVTQEGLNTAELTVGQLKEALVGAENQWGLCWNVWNAGDCAISRATVAFFAVEQYGEEADIAFDEWGNISCSEFEGYSVDARVKFTYTVETTEGESGHFNGWGVGSITDKGQSSEGPGLSVTGEGNNVYVTTLGDLAELLYSGECGLYWNVWGLEDGGNSITVARVSVTIAEPVTTALRPVTSDSEVVKTDYYNLVGVRSTEPTKGMNVVVRTMSDGTTQVDKQLVK